MPILGIWASQISGKLFAPSGAYDSIATVTVGSAVSSITFSSIPSTYTHLQVRGILNNSGFDAALITLNGDTGSNYARHRLSGNGSTTNAAGASGITFFAANSFVGFPSTANVYGGLVMDVLDYANTSKNTTARILSGFDNNSSGEVSLNSGLWNNTAAVTSITFTASGGNWAQYSQLALYGIKGN